MGEPAMECVRADCSRHFDIVGCLTEKQSVFRAWPRIRT